ncbi:hypothetical protein J7J60_00610 [bacterium]|nr:hypothetical protein [bacterium]
MKKLAERIKSIPKTYFYFADIKKITNLSDKSLKVALNRLVKDKKLIRITRGVYTININKVDWQSLAVEIYYPSYLSFEWALSYYNIMSQKPIHLTLATINRSKTIKTSQRNLIYHHLQERMFWGYKKEANYLVATPEKALLDQAYLSLNGYAKFDIEEMNLEGLNKKRLKTYLKRVDYTRLNKYLRPIVCSISKI